MLFKDDVESDFKSKRPFSADYLPNGYVRGLNSRISTREQSIDSLESIPGNKQNNSILKSHSITKKKYIKTHFLQEMYFKAMIQAKKDVTKIL